MITTFILFFICALLSFALGHVKGEHDAKKAAQQAAGTGPPLGFPYALSAAVKPQVFHATRLGPKGATGHVREMILREAAGELANVLFASGAICVQEEEELTRTRLNLKVIAYRLDAQGLPTMQEPARARPSGVEPLDRIDGEELGRLN